MCSPHLKQAQPSTPKLCHNNSAHKVCRRRGVWVAHFRRGLNASRSEVAQALVARGEAWMREQGLQRAATNTSSSNEKLIRLFEGQGYAIVLRVDQMVHLSRSL